MPGKQGVLRGLSGAPPRTPVNTIHGCIVHEGHACPGSRESCGGFPGLRPGPRLIQCMGVLCMGAMHAREAGSPAGAFRILPGISREKSGMIAVMAGEH